MISDSQDAIRFSSGARLQSKKGRTRGGGGETRSERERETMHMRSHRSLWMDGWMDMYLSIYRQIRLQVCLSLSLSLSLCPLSHLSLRPFALAWGLRCASHPSTRGRQPRSGHCRLPNAKQKHTYIFIYTSRHSLLMPLFVYVCLCFAIEQQERLAIEH